jgi:hypothetical protein
MLKRIVIPLLVLGAPALLVLLILGGGASSSCPNPPIQGIFGRLAPRCWFPYDPAPTQPIAFSHQIHVSRVGLPCTFCHIYVDKSRRAGVPSVQKCMSCHSVIAVDRPEIKKLHRYWNDKEPIPWVKVHNMPGHVYFSHKRHVKAGLECSACHGEIKNVSVVRRVSSLKMGFCVTCHRAKKASLDCLTCHQ